MPSLIHEHKERKLHASRDNERYRSIFSCLALRRNKNIWKHFRLNIELTMMPLYFALISQFLVKFCAFIIILCCLTDLLDSRLQSNPNTVQRFHGEGNFFVLERNCTFLGDVKAEVKQEIIKDRLQLHQSESRPCEARKKNK